MGQVHNELARIIDYENNNLDAEQVLQFFADITKTGLVWQLQGSYGRMANTLIEEGFIDREGNVADDAVERINS